MANHWKWRKLSISATCLWRKQGRLAQVSVWKVLGVASRAHPEPWGASLTTSQLSARQPKRRQDLSRRLWRSLIKPSRRLSSVASNQRRSQRETRAAIIVFVASMWIARVIRRAGRGTPHRLSRPWHVLRTQRTNTIITRWTSGK